MSVKNFGLSEERSDEFPKFSSTFAELIFSPDLSGQREKEFSFVISFDPAKEITLMQYENCKKRNDA
jgi:hypothetical protein